LRTEAAQSDEIIARLQSSDLGTRNGYMDQLLALTRVNENGVSG
jgi:hypothetical protein